MFTYNNKHSEQGGNKLSPKSVNVLQGLYKVAPRHKISFTIITLPVLNSIYIDFLLLVVKHFRKITTMGSFFNESL